MLFLFYVLRASWFIFFEMGLWRAKQYGRQD
jgi:hypothetical protein